MRLLSKSFVLAAILSLASSSIVAAASPTATTDGATAIKPSADTSVALVQLNMDPLSTYVKTKPTQGKKIDLNSNTTKSYRAQLSAYRNQFKQWLQAAAPKAKVTGSWDLAVDAVSVQLNGTKLSTISASSMVKHVEYVGYYHPSIDDPDLALIHAVDAWNQGPSSPANAGEGVKIAMIDSGIDQTHPCFSDAGYPAQTQLGDTNFTNNKVIVAKVFYMKNPSRQFTAAPVSAHGTHTAGTAACDYHTGPITVDGASVPYAMSGVAPRALLGNYNIFPNGIENARSEDILNALEAAYTDGFDIANMSIGGGSSGFQDLVAMAIDDLDQANMVVAVAAGNSAEGNTDPPHLLAPGHMTVESPGKAARELTAGAFSVGHSVAVLVQVAGTSFLTSGGDFAVPASDITGPLAEAPVGSPISLVGNHLDGCADYGSNDETGKIVIVARGTCSFGEKAYHAEHAGAVGVIISNREDAYVSMLADDLFPVTIPVVFVTKTDGLAIYGHVGESTTLTPPSYVNIDDPLTQNAAPDKNVQSLFSSQGPTDVDFRVKPDVMAPGENVLSSIPEDQCDHDVDAHCYAFFAGTSMATPHLAGSAAVVKWEHPTWSAAQIRSAIVNTADQGVIKSGTDGTTILTDPNIIGSGRENLLSAVNAVIAIDPVSISFGAVPGGSGQGAGYPVAVTNLSGSSKTFTFSVGTSTGTGLSYGVTPSITLASGASGWIWVTMAADKGASGGDHYTKLIVKVSGTEVAHAVVYTYIK